MTVKLQDDSPTTLSPLEVGAEHPVGAPGSCLIGLQAPSDPHLLSFSLVEELQGDCKK